MRRIALLSLLLAGAAIAEPVIITVREDGPAACPLPPPPALQRQVDGSYVRPVIVGVHAVACWSNNEWREEWTAPPENGGTFIRRIVESKPKP